MRFGHRVFSTETFDDLQFLPRKDPQGKHIPVYCIILETPEIRFKNSRRICICKKASGRDGCPTENKCDLLEINRQGFIGRRVTEDVYALGTKHKTISIHVAHGVIIGRHAARQPCCYVRTDIGRHTCGLSVSSGVFCVNESAYVRLGDARICNFVE